MAIPFGQALFRQGVAATFGVRLFDEKTIFVSKAIRLAGTTPQEFMDHLAHLHIMVTHQRPNERELEISS